MAYHTTADVQSNIAKFTLGVSTKPSTTQVAIIMAQVEGEIDSILAARGITVPVTTPAEFMQALKSIASAGSAARTLKSMFPDAVGADETPAYAYWQRIYDRGLEGLKDGSLVPDAVTGATSGYVAPSTYLTNNPDTEVDLGDVAEPFFTRGKTF